MKIISSTINLGQIKTVVTRTSRHYLLAKKNLVKPPPKTKNANRKVQPLLMWMEFIFPLICMLGVTFSLDVITMSFKGRHEYKISMTYKSEGDLLQTDNIFHKGYTYQIFICNGPVSKKTFS